LAVDVDSKRVAVMTVSDKGGEKVVAAEEGGGGANGSGTETVHRASASVLPPPVAPGTRVVTGRSRMAADAP
jgi:hypothetical protein